MSLYSYGASITFVRASVVILQKTEVPWEVLRFVDDLVYSSLDTAARDNSKIADLLAHYVVKELIPCDI